jgi:hypothetical protein
VKQFTLRFIIFSILFVSIQTVYNQNYTAKKTKEHYLMITAPEYESTLTYFANYKRNIGFEVRVVTTNTTGKTAASIKKYIQNQYNNKSTRPTYLLLVGDVDKIPAFEGNASGTDKNKPVSDLGYVLLEGKNYLADVFLGRFSVSTIEELKNIIHKTIFMELNMNRFIKKAKFLTGDDITIKKHYMRNNFKKGHEYAIRNCFEPSGFSCETLYQPDKTKAVRALSDHPLFFMYAGHGGFSSLSGKSFVLDSRDLQIATNKVFPLVFAFACKTGNFAHPQNVSMSEAFIRAEKGAVAYFGASVNTTTDSDLVLEKKIFGAPFKNSPSNLSALINAGMRKFAKSHIVHKKVVRNLKSYNLLGDPSLNLDGIKLSQQYEISYTDSAQTVKQQEFINLSQFSVFKNPASDDFSLAYKLDNNSFVHLDLNDMLGNHIRTLLHLPDEKAGIYFHHFSLTDLPAGSYALVFKDAVKTITYIVFKQ